MVSYHFNWFIHLTALDFAYNEFGYYKHQAIPSRFFFLKKNNLIDINVKKVQLSLTMITLINLIICCKRDRMQEN